MPTSAAAVNLNGMSILLGLIKFFINGEPTFINGSGSLPGNPCGCVIL